MSLSLMWSALDVRRDRENRVRVRQRDDEDLEEHSKTVAFESLDEKEGQIKNQ